jgi:hypothetical protein
MLEIYERTPQALYGLVKPMSSYCMVFASHISLVVGVKNIFVYSALLQY